MERKKQVGSSSTSDIFGDKESSLPASSSSAGVFASIFPPPPTIVGRRLSLDFVGSQQKQPFGNHAWSSKHVDPVRSDNGSCNASFKDGSIFREERGELCHLSSSLLYGGQDVYSRSSGNQATGSYPMSKKDGVEDDRNGSDSPDASRGNWWQGIQKPDEVKKMQDIMYMASRLVRDMAMHRHIAASCKYYDGHKTMVPLLCISQFSCRRVVAKDVSSTSLYHPYRKVLFSLSDKKIFFKASDINAQRVSHALNEPFGQSNDYLPSMDRCNGTRKGKETNENEDSMMAKGHKRKKLGD